MKLKITVDMNLDNAAFKDSPGTEVDRILRRVVRKAEAMADRRYGFEHNIHLFDLNGNDVGVAHISID